MEESPRISHPPVPSGALRADYRDIDTYTIFFKDVDEQAELSLNISRTIMNDYNINLVKIDDIPCASHPSYSEPYVLCVNVERGAAVLTYHVFVGPFVVNVKVLNIDEDLINSSEIRTLGNGGFGLIVALNDGN
jgi:hypothetical protein